jgi:hypothetical protein
MPPLPIDREVQLINRILRGWVNSFAVRISGGGEKIRRERQLRERFAWNSCAYRGLANCKTKLPTFARAITVLEPRVKILRTFISIPANVHAQPLAEDIAQRPIDGVDDAVAKGEEVVDRLSKLPRLRRNAVGDHLDPVIVLLVKVSTSTMVAQTHDTSSANIPRTHWVVRRDGDYRYQFFVRF